MWHQGITGWHGKMYLYDSVLVINYKTNYRLVIDRIRDKCEEYCCLVIKSL